MEKIKLPAIIEDFIAEKIITNVPLLPCVYDDFEKMQLGYRINPLTQKTLIDNDTTTGWQAHWYVIAQNELGDPFFVDLAIKNYPVYTAVHGRGGWKAIEVSENLKTFKEVLNRINQEALTFPCNLNFLGERIDLESEFWFEVNESCQEVD